MNNENYKPVSNSLALTIRKEHRITIKKVSKTIARMTLKTLLYLLLLTLANVFV